jgi:hypothetical protein
MKKAVSPTRLFRFAGVLMVALGSIIMASDPADARRGKELVQGAAIGAGIGVLVDGSSGVLSGATAGALVAAISRKSR